MKKIFIFSILLVSFSSVFAQRYAQTDNIHVSGLYNFKDGYNINAGFEKLFSNSKYSFDLSAEYFQTKDVIPDLRTKIEIANVLANASLNVYIPLFNDLYLRLGAGGVAGYQLFEFDKPDYIQKTEDNRLVYGFSAPAQIEYSFGTVSIFAEYKATYLFKSRDKGYQAVGLGAKIYF